VSQSIHSSDRRCAWPASLIPSLLLLSVLLFVGPAAAQDLFPVEEWGRAESAEALGYSSAGLAAAQEYAGTIDTAAVMIIVNGQILDEWGETARKFNVHSIRKSLLSALYGIYVAEGNIDLNLTMEQLGVDDNEPSLSEFEKTATIHDLLKARSGIYHPALYESASMAAARPQRHSHAPGTFWYYNNWDFNALGTIFRNLTMTDVYREFKRRIGDRIGMQDFDPDTDGRYFTGPDSVYPAYPFRLTARDMARFGLLFLRAGEWNGSQVVPRQWVRDSVTSYSDAQGSGGYGYMWWVAADGRHLPNVTLDDGSFSARGAGGHYILVLPSRDMVIVHRVNTDVAGNRVASAEFGTLVKMILDAEQR
jgi:CubicO group peptidase (beta-lactamase class C family)